MSMVYNFFGEVQYQGKWHNLGYQNLGADGSLRHQVLASVSRSFLGRLGDLVDSAAPIPFEDLAESTREIFLRDFAEYGGSVQNWPYRYLCDLPTLESLAGAPYENEYYLTANQIALLERGEADDIDEYLTAKELLALPETARREYTLYRWDEPLDSRQTIQGMVDALHHQISCFEQSIPADSQSKPDVIRVIYKIS